MAVVADRVTVGTSATRLAKGASGTYREGSALLVVPQASGTLILGPAGVTASNGARVPVTTGEKLSFDLDYAEELWAVVASGTLAVDTVQVGA
jgi:hypothetical protein